MADSDQVIKNLTKENTKLKKYIIRLEKVVHNTWAWENACIVCNEYDPPFEHVCNRDSVVCTNCAQDLKECPQCGKEL